MTPDDPRAEVYRLGLHDPVVRAVLWRYEHKTEGTLTWEESLTLMVKTLVEQNQELREALLDARMRLPPIMLQPSAP